MRVAVFDTRPYDRRSLEMINSQYRHDLHFFEGRLTLQTVRLALGFNAVCVFVNDVLDAPVLEILAEQGVRIIALRCSGFNNVDLNAAGKLGLSIVRVPDYSPYAVAEHTIALLLTLNRKIHRAFSRVREGNFSLNGLVGFDLHGKTAGIIGTGKIGCVLAKIMRGFGCKLLAYDRYPNEQLASELGLDYVPLDSLISESDIISLHIPLTPENTHLINSETVAKMKRGVILLNTSRGGLIDADSVIDGLKSGQIGGFAADVYEKEAGLFFQDLSDRVIQDDVLARLLTFPNVLMTGHQAFLTDTALHNIADTTLGNLTALEAGLPCPNSVTRESPHPPKT